LGLSLSTFTYTVQPSKDGPVRDKLIELAGENKRFGHPRLFVLLKNEMPEVNHKRSHRIYTDLDLQIERRKRKKTWFASKATANKSYRARPNLGH
jgi:putative transposase